MISTACWRERMRREPPHSPPHPTPTPTPPQHISVLPQPKPHISHTARSQPRPTATQPPLTHPPIPQADPTYPADRSHLSRRQIPHEARLFRLLGRGVPARVSSVGGNWRPFAGITLGILSWCQTWRQQGKVTRTCFAISMVSTSSLAILAIPMCAY